MLDYRFALTFITVFLASCGGNIATESWESQNAPDEAVIKTGSKWDEAPAAKPCAAPTQPEPSPSASPVPAPSASPWPSPTPPEGPAQPSRRPAWCKLFPWVSKCELHALSMVLFESPCNLNSSPVPSVHNTRFCQVDESGRIISEDQSNVYEEGDVVHGVSGGCIARPIREVWAIFLNDSVMRPDDVDEYTGTPRPDLVPSSAGNRTEFVFDLYNVHSALGGMVNPSWTVRWYHAIPYGDYENPNQIVINFQKVQGTDHIRQLRGGYVLDRTTDGITSYAMEQWANADRYGTEKASGDMARNFERLRNGAANWAALPAIPPVFLPKR